MYLRICANRTRWSCRLNSCLKFFFFTCTIFNSAPITMQNMICTVVVQAESCILVSRHRHVVYINLNITLSYILDLYFSWALIHSTVHNLHFIGLVSRLLYLSATAMLELCIEEKYKASYPLLMTCIPHFIKILQCVWKISDFINSSSYCVEWLMNWKVYGTKRVCPKLIYLPVNYIGE
jgi:hypothetical protein